MTFATREISEEGGQPVELYDISLDSENFYFTTTDRDDLTFDLNLYIPAILDRTQPKVDNDQPGSEVQLEFSTSEAVVQDLIGRWVTAAPEVESNSVMIRKYHIGEAVSEIQPFWFGTIASVKYKNMGQTAQIICRSLTDLFTLQGPRKTWGTQCNHQLYDGECTLSRAVYTVESVVASVSGDGLTFTMSPPIASPTTRYNAGEFRKKNTALSRLIVQRSGNLVTVQYPIPEIVIGDTVEVIEGCEHNLTDCLSFSNDINYGGTPFTPPINPFTKGLDAL